MRMIVLLLVIGGALASAIPEDISRQMKSEEPEYREVQMTSPISAVIVLHFPKARLWVITKIRMVAPDYWSFTDKDIELIAREENGELKILFERKDGI